MKKIISFFIGLIVIISMTGCQKTPDSPIVIGKDYEEMMNQALL